MEKPGWHAGQGRACRAPGQAALCGAQRREKGTRWRGRGRGRGRGRRKAGRGGVGAARATVFSPGWGRGAGLAGAATDARMDKGEPGASRTCYRCVCA